MAITSAQRQVAIAQLLNDPGFVATTLGITYNQLLGGLVSALGTAFDAQMSQVLAAMIVRANAGIPAKASPQTVAAVQALTQAWTVV